MTVAIIPPLVLAGLIDAPRSVGLGPVSLLAALAIAQIGWAVLVLILTGRYPRTLLLLLLPWALYLVWMLTRSLYVGLVGTGIQNFVVYLLFGANLLLAGTLAALAPISIQRALTAGMLAMDACGLGLVAASIAGSGDWLIGPRSLGLVAIVATSWHLAGWYYGRPWSGVRVVAWSAGVLLSSSRMAVAVVLVNAAIVALCQAKRRPLRALRKVPGVIAAAIVVLIVIAAQWATLYERFVEGYTRVDVGGVSISTSGRSEFWPVVIDSAMQNPLFGAGLGSSQVALGDFNVEVVGHPHNDYLRFWHDGGLVALFLAVAGMLWWLCRLWRQWRMVDAAGLPLAHLDLAGVLTLLGVLLAAMTDNGFVYAFLMAPAGILIGAALGCRLLLARHPSTLLALKDAFEPDPPIRPDRPLQVHP